MLMPCLNPGGCPKITRKERVEIGSKRWWSKTCDSSEVKFCFWRPTETLPTAEYVIINNNFLIFWTNNQITIACGNLSRSDLVHLSISFDISYRVDFWYSTQPSSSVHLQPNFVFHSDTNLFQLQRWCFWPPTYQPNSSISFSLKVVDIGFCIHPELKRPTDAASKSAKGQLGACGNVDVHIQKIYWIYERHGKLITTYQNYKLYTVYTLYKQPYKVCMF